VDKVKQEEESHPGGHSIATPTSNGPYTTSPSHQHYPPGPPPPYTHAAPTHAHTWPGANPSVHTPPESRRTSGDDVDHAKQPGRQLLPSISEAIGPLDGQPPYHQPASAPEPSPQHHPYLPPSQPAAPRSPPTRRLYATEPPPPPPNPFAPYSSYRQDSAGPPTSLADPNKPAYGSIQDSIPHSSAPATYPPTRTQQPAPHLYPHPPQSQPVEHHPAGSTSMPPPPPPQSTFSYGYASYPPKYAQPTPESSSGPIYHPSTQHAPPSASAWKVDPGVSRYPNERAANPPYGESVKRHLDMYDLEASINEVSGIHGIL
jgi:hypothetical protein